MLKNFAPVPCTPNVSVPDWCPEQRDVGKTNRKFREISFCCRTGADWVASSVLTIWPLHESITWLKGWKKKKTGLIFHWSSLIHPYGPQRWCWKGRGGLMSLCPAGLAKPHLNPVHYSQDAVQGAEASGPLKGLCLTTPLMNQQSCSKNWSK